MGNRLPAVTCSSSLNKLVQSPKSGTAPVNCFCIKLLDRAMTHSLPPSWGASLNYKQHWGMFFLLLLGGQSRLRPHVSAVCPAYSTGELLLCRQESMAAVLAAAGLLEVLAKGTLALPLRSPVIQALCGILTTACADSQAEVAALGGFQGKRSDGKQPGCVHWRDAAALACCNTWQVSHYQCERQRIILQLLIRLYYASHPICVHAFLSLCLCSVLSSLD